MPPGAQQIPQPHSAFGSLPPIAGMGPGMIELHSASIPAKRSAPTGGADSSQPPEKKGKWTPEEDQLAIELRRTGMKWDDIAKRLPGRSAISCRLRYQNYSEKRQDWDEEKKNKLARLYNRFKQQMWEMVAKEMGLPWRAIEGIHWEMGREEMASRANVPVFQPHLNATMGRTNSPPEQRMNVTLAPAPSTPGVSSDDQQPILAQSARTIRARSASTGSRRRASTRKDAPPQLSAVSEMEGLQPTSDPSPRYVSDIPNTPASSVEQYNGSPAARPFGDERLPPRPTPPHLRQLSSGSHNSSDAPLPPVLTPAHPSVPPP